AVAVRTVVDADSVEGFDAGYGRDPVDDPGGEEDLLGGDGTSPLERHLERGAFPARPDRDDAGYFFTANRDAVRENLPAPHLEERRGRNAVAAQVAVHPA